jgi:hypothetical protein
VSHHPSHSTEHLPPPEEQAQEAIHWGKVLGVGVGSLVVFTLAVWISTAMMRSREKALQPIGPDPMPMQIGQQEIGIVDQIPYDVSRSVQGYKDDRAAKLSSWGWVDRKAGTVRMPIDQAMERVVKEQRR